jgi:CDP-diglyceride synthetase
MKFAWVALLTLLCSIILGVLAPMMLFSLVSSADPDASDKWDDTYALPALCAIFIAGPIAAGLAARFFSSKVLARFRPEPAPSQDWDGCLSNAAGVVAVALSWLLVATGWIYGLLGPLVP